MDGGIFSYKVVEINVLAPTAVEEMISGEYDLTLFTCTYSRKDRIAVRCEYMEREQ